ncbi:LysR family transcriptional regulator [Pseudomonas sp. NPDC087358]|uniref:LysR family transcriptional regulator n=1 Tax=Pseudomonas sp. NPDC087358 TaxID=3364439 RepID=UPI00384F172B
MFDWDDLRFFSTFAREGSLAAAARSLGVEHATVARRIASLEASLALKLVDRRARLYAITADGLRVSEFAEQMSSTSFALQRFAGGEHDRIEGEVVISSPPAFLATLIAPNIGKLRERYPGLHLRMVGSKSTASLARKESDVAVLYARPEEAQVVARHLADLPFALYASERYLAGHASEDFVFIGYDQSMEHSVQQQWLRAHQGGRSQVISSNDLRVQAQAAAGDAGLVLLPAFLATEYRLRRAPTCDTALSLPVWLAYHEDLRNAGKIRVVLDFLIECLASPDQL